MKSLGTLRTPKAILVTGVAVFLLLVAASIVRPALVARAASAIQYAQPVDGSLGPGQAAEYTLAGKAGDKLTVIMNTTGGELTPMVRLFDPLGKLLGENDNAGKYRAMLQGIVLGADGTYKVTALNENKAGSGKFGLIILQETAKGAIYFDGKPTDKEAFQLTQPLNHTNVTYRLVNTQPGVNAQDVRTLIAQAFQAWSAVTPLTFREVSSGQSDLVIEFASIDGPYSVLGETCPPSSPCAGQIQFDSDETWTMGPPRSTQDISLLAVASHEFGHAIGLLHSNDPNALMYYAYSPYNLKPGPDDIAGAQRLYGPGAGRAGNSPTSIPPISPNPNPNPNQPVVQGTLDNSHFRQFWDFDVEAGDTVTISMKKVTGNLDSLLVLLDANNHVLAYDDDGGGGRDAMLRNVKLPQRGTYTIAATRYQQVQGFTAGNYSLTIDYNHPTASNNPNTPSAQPIPTTAAQPGNTGDFGGVQVSQGPAEANGQMPSLDSVLDQPFADSATPTSQTRHATVQRPQAYVWTLTWCARDNAALQNNLKDIAVTFAVNGKPVPANLVTQTPQTLNGQSCVDYSVIVSNWSANQLTLTATMTMRNNVFDGNKVYAAGNYIYQYTVQAQ